MNYPEQSWLPTLDPMAYPVALPHLTCLNDRLYLGSRDLGAVSATQSEFLRNCKGTHPFAELLQQHSIDARDIIHLSKYLVWWPRAVDPNIHPFERSERLIFCSSPEIPWLGMGGRILNDAPKITTTLLSCFTTTLDAINPLYNSASEHLLARRDELCYASGLAGVHTINWSNSMRPIEDSYSTTLIHSFISAVDPAEIFIPASLALNNGASLIQKLVIALLAEGQVQSTVHIYEDAPSILGFRPIDEFHTRFENAYLTPVQYYTDISAVSTWKSALLELFRCDLSHAQKSRWLSSDLKNARMSGDQRSTHSERFWKMNFSAFI